MIPPLVRLPATRLDLDGLAVLAGVVERLGAARTVILGAQRRADGVELDEFVVATSIAWRCEGTALGIAARVDAGRAASVVAREATAATLLGACDVVVLEGPTAACRDAAEVLVALFTEGVHTVTTPSASILAARNLPLPDAQGGPPVCWRDGSVLLQLVDGSASESGTVVEVAAGGPLPAPEPGVLVVVAHPLGTPSALAAALRS
jgi:hypothetical protein